MAIVPAVRAREPLGGEPVGGRMVAWSGDSGLSPRLNYAALYPLASLIN